MLHCYGNIAPFAFFQSDSVMPQKVMLFFSLVQARLSRTIVLWVFISIVIVELIILLPSVQRRESELLQNIEQIGLSSLAPVIALSHHKKDFETIFQSTRQIIHNFPVLGGSIYLPDGTLVANFGEMPQINYQDVIEQLRKEPVIRKRIDTVYNVAWLIHEQIEGEILFKYLLDKLQYCQAVNCQQVNSVVLILRFDAKTIQNEVIAYIWRIAGLVLIICLFVTAVTSIALAPIVIAPIIRLRHALMEASYAVKSHDPQPYLLTVTRKDEIGDVMREFNLMIQRLATQVEEIKARENALQLANREAESLLLNILPAPIAQQLKAGVSPIAHYHPEATVLFADLVDFTQLSAQVSPEKMVKLLNQLFTSFDHLAETYGLEKIKTIGDAYMVVGGVPLACNHHVRGIAEMALAMRDIISEFRLCDEGSNLNIRIGIHTGAVIAGVIGVKKFIYDLWGDTVNTASRMESHGIAGEIQVSATTFERLKDCYAFEERGWIEVKGKGQMLTYLLKHRLAEKPVSEDCIVSCVPVSQEQAIFI